MAQMRRAAAKGSWKASAWLLERQAPERWVRDSARGKVPEEPASLDPFGEVDELAQKRAAHA